MNAQTYEQPPSELERADDERYSHEYAAMVAWFRTSLESWNAYSLTARVAELARGKFALSHEQPLLAFIEWYGYAKLLRALARAIEQPNHVLGDLEGD
jgi:hypothetical protein